MIIKRKGNEQKKSAGCNGRTAGIPASNCRSIRVKSRDIVFRNRSATVPQLNLHVVGRMWSFTAGIFLAGSWKRRCHISNTIGNFRPSRLR